MQLGWTPPNPMLARVERVIERHTLADGILPIEAFDDLNNRSLAIKLLEGMGYKKALSERSGNIKFFYKSDVLTDEQIALKTRRNHKNWVVTGSMSERFLTRAKQADFVPIDYFGKDKTEIVRRCVARLRKKGFVIVVERSKGRLVGYNTSRIK